MYTYSIRSREIPISKYFIKDFSYNHYLECRLVSNRIGNCRYYFFSKSYDQLEKARNEMRNMTPTAIKEIRLDEVPEIKISFKTLSPKSKMTNRNCSYADLNL